MISKNEIDDIFKKLSESNNSEEPWEGAWENMEEKLSKGYKKYPGGFSLTKKSLLAIGLLVFISGGIIYKNFNNTFQNQAILTEKEPNKTKKDLKVTEELLIKTGLKDDSNIEKTNEGSIQNEKTISEIKANENTKHTNSEKKIIVNTIKNEENKNLKVEKKATTRAIKNLNQDKYQIKQTILTENEKATNYSSTSKNFEKLPNQKNDIDKLKFKSTKEKNSSVNSELEKYPINQYSEKPQLTNLKSKAESNYLEENQINSNYIKDLNPVFDETLQNSEILLKNTFNSTNLLALKSITKTNFNSNFRFSIVPLKPKTYNEISKPSELLKKGIFFRIGYSPDLSSISGNKTTKVGTNYSALIEWRMSPKWTINGGIIKSMKYYDAYPEQYNWPANWKKPPNPLIEIIATCNMLDIPINLRYDFKSTQNKTFFVSSGITSYVMLKEKYEYEYENNDDPSIKWKKWEGSTGNYKLGVLNLSAGMEFITKKKVSFQLEPYSKISLMDIGFGKVKLNSFGLLISSKIPIYKF